jgi:phosphomannomutase
MTLINSISGIRGTIGGRPGDNLTPYDLVKFASAFAAFIRKRSSKSNPMVVVGRDARISGAMVNKIVCGTLMASGIDVTDIGLSTTPTVEIAVPGLRADGGIILTASHNPAQWNALKLLNEKGEFLSAAEGEKILKLAEEEHFEYSEVKQLGLYATDNSWIGKHIEKVLQLPLVDVEAIRKAGYRIVIDAVNSSGGLVVPRLLKALGVADVIELYCTPDGNFPHNPEPLPAHLSTISAWVVQHKAHLGFVVDPDVDRLAIVDEHGAMFGEEYTLVAVADYVLKHKPGPAVSNLSSSRALRDISSYYGQPYYASAVGEVNVVEMMKARNAVIGGEGNGGVIYPELHYGRDALVGIALFLSHLAKSAIPCSELRASYPTYRMTKNKVQLNKQMDVEKLLHKVATAFRNEKVNKTDGVKIDFANGWVHLRKSNTEPIIRIYSEAENEQQANQLASKVMALIGKLTTKS